MKSLVSGWSCSMWRLVFLLCFLRGFGVKGISCEIQVYTSYVPYAGTDADVHIVLNGTKGTSESIPLNNGHNNCEKGKVDSFNVETRDIGALCSVRIHHNNKGFAAGWHLEKIRIICNHGNTYYTFLCNCWLSTTDGDKKTERTISATEPCTRRK
ncbi:lipoxygenase homology domain-containing protein 1-like [Pomacea canaliculata]|uniref:lipoxygenase homology domain-containing protein 1-like n=1 Tax=Pomacea canaliculata TaxID=400727 RepID=UPI000D72D784|nr:lipoxygenase homology domain-containing protein 1-like [Pomacea canaliculata]